jgi:hypothetical protein
MMQAILFALTFLSPSPEDVDTRMSYLCMDLWERYIFCTNGGAGCLPDEAYATGVDLWEKGCFGIPTYPVGLP